MFRSVFLVTLLYFSIVSGCDLPAGYDRCVDYAFNETQMSHLSPFRMIVPKGYWKDHYFCACDSECHNYDDCCANVTHSKADMKSNLNMSCIDVIGSNVAVHAIDSCSASFSNPQIETKCLSGHLNASHLYEHFLVYSRTSKVLYKNVYCAICNGDTNELMSFPINMSCNDKSSNLNITSFDQLWLYGKEYKTWKYGNTSIECKFQQKEHLIAIMNGDINARPCQKSVKTCHSTWNDTNGDLAQMCRNYTSYVFAYDSSRVYKNIHCATCNYENEFFCTSEENVESRINFSFRTLLDINFDQCKPRRRQMYDKDLKTCVNYKTGRVGSAKSSRSGIRTFSIVSTSNESKVEDSKQAKVCKSVTHPMKAFVKVDENTVYINDTKRLYSKSEFYLNEDNTVSVCVEEFHALPRISDKIQAILSYFCLVSSIICLGLQLIVYSLIPRLRTIPGKILMSLSLSLLVAHISFLSMALIDVNQKNIVCIIDALFTHYFFLCSFFWMNVMSFDIYTVFGRFERKQRDYDFLIYSLYAWLCPAVIILFAMVNEYLIDYNDYQPMYGVHNCWVGQQKSLLLFFVIPLTIIVIVNLALFALTTRELLMTKKLTKTIAKKEETIRFKLYLKIAVLMGLTWVFGVAATFSGLLFIWYPFIVFNGLQGVFIFFTFAFKRDNIDCLKNILKREKSMSNTETRSTNKS